MAAPTKDTKFVHVQDSKLFFNPPNNHQCYTQQSQNGNKIEIQIRIRIKIKIKEIKPRKKLNREGDNFGNESFLSILTNTQNHIVFIKLRNSEKFRDNKMRNSS